MVAHLAGHDFPKPAASHIGLADISDASWFVSLIE